MSEKSPLFISAMELLGHSVELLELKDAKKNKFVVLHLSNAIELLMKDMVIDIGESIFERKSKMTINIWAAFDILEKRGVTIVNRPKIELLIDDRNAIQHKFGYPSEELVFYYLELVIDFFRACISQRYTTVFDDVALSYFSPSGIVLVGVKPNDDLAKADAIAKYDLLSGVAMAYGVLEAKVENLLGQEGDSRPVMIWHNALFDRLLKLLNPNDLEGRKPQDYFNSIRQLRNIAVHRQHHEIAAMESKMREGLSDIKKFIAAIDAVPEEKIQAIRNLE